MYAANPVLTQKPKLLIFDVNETLLDLSGMKQSINKALNHKFAFNQWFGFMLQYSLVDTVTGNYHDFGTIGKAAMQIVQERLGRNISDAKVQGSAKYDKISSSPPGYRAWLKESGYRMITLTNSNMK